jgi:hypothetical protein
VSRNTDLVQTSVAAFITKWAGLVRYRVQRGRGSLLLWSAAKEGTVRRRRCKAGVAIGGEMRAMLDMDFGELTFHALRSIALRRMRQGPRISVSYNTQCFTILTFQAILDTIDTYRQQRSLMVA